MLQSLSEVAQACMRKISLGTINCVYAHSQHLVGLVSVSTITSVNDQADRRSTHMGTAVSSGRSPGSTASRTF